MLCVWQSDKVESNWGEHVPVRDEEERCKEGGASDQGSQPNSLVRDCHGHRRSWVVGVFGTKEHRHTHVQSLTYAQVIVDGFTGPSGSPARCRADAGCSCCMYGTGSSRSWSRSVWVRSRLAHKSRGHATTRGVCGCEGDERTRDGLWA